MVYIYQHKNCLTICFFQHFTISLLLFPVSSLFIFLIFLYRFPSPCRNFFLTPAIVFFATIINNLFFPWHVSLSLLVFFFFPWNTSRNLTRSNVLMDDFVIWEFFKRFGFCLRSSRSFVSIYFRVFDPNILWSPWSGWLNFSKLETLLWLGTPKLLQMREIENWNCNKSLKID